MKSTIPRWWRIASLTVAGCVALIAVVIGARPATAQPQTDVVAARTPTTSTPPPTPLLTSLISPSPQPTSSPSSTPRPSGSGTLTPTATTPPAAPNQGQDSDGCGFFDVACKVKAAINGWFKSLVKDAINPVFGLLGKSLLATPQLDGFPRVHGLWTGSLVVANACYVLLIVIGGLTLMGHQTLQTSYTIKQIAPRLVLGMVASNVSLLLIGKAITFANALSAALLGQGVDPQAAAGQLQKNILHAINPHGVGSFIILLVNGAVLLGVILVLIYIIRITLTILLIAAAPLALACHALPQTEYLAKLWWRALGGVLAIQVAQALVFIAAVKVFFTADAVAWFGVRTPGDQLDLWITLCLLYVLIRIPSWISRMIWQGGLSRSPIARVARTIATIAIFRGLLGKLGRTRAAGRTPPSRPPVPPGRLTPPRALPPGPPPPPPTQPEPRWAHPDNRWMPPDPEWHARVHHGRPDADSVSEQQRWGHPATTWTPPHAGDWRTPAPTPPRPPAPPPRRPDPNRPWHRPN